MYWTRLDSTVVTLSWFWHLECFQKWYDFSYFEPIVIRFVREKFSFFVEIYLITFFEKLLKSYQQGERLPAPHPLHSYFIPKPSAFIGRMVVTNIWEFAIMTMIFVNWAANLWIFFNFLEIEDQQYVEQLLAVLLFHNCKHDIFFIPQSDFAENKLFLIYKAWLTHKREKGYQHFIPSSLFSIFLLKIT